MSIVFDALIEFFDIAIPQEISKTSPMQVFSRTSFLLCCMYAAQCAQISQQALHTGDVRAQVDADGEVEPDAALPEASAPAKQEHVTSISHHSHVAKHEQDPHEHSVEIDATGHLREVPEAAELAEHASSIVRPAQEHAASKEKEADQNTKDSGFGSHAHHKGPSVGEVMKKQLVVVPPVAIVCILAVAILWRWREKNADRLRNAMAEALAEKDVAKFEAALTEAKLAGVDAATIQHAEKNLSQLVIETAVPSADAAENVAKLKAAVALVEGENSAEEAVGAK